jgi:hypothetical protein
VAINWGVSLYLISLLSLAVEFVVVHAVGAHVATPCWR